MNLKVYIYLREHIGCYQINLLCFKRRDIWIYNNMGMPIGLEVIRRGYVYQFINNSDDSQVVWCNPWRDCVIRKINSPIILSSFLKFFVVLRLNRFL